MYFIITFPTNDHNGIFSLAHVQLINHQNNGLFSENRISRFHSGNYIEYERNIYAFL